METETKRLRLMVLYGYNKFWEKRGERPPWVSLTDIDPDFYAYANKYNGVYSESECYDDPTKEQEQEDLYESFWI